MKIEHVGLQVRAPAAMADWYMEHLGFHCVRSGDSPFPVRYISDDSGRMVLEVYTNPAVGTTDYGKLDPLQLHVAFLCDDLNATTERLVRAGAKLVSAAEVKPNGDELAMLRDPWGLPIQMCRRRLPIVKE